MHKTILAQVFSFLNTDELLQANLVCKIWNEVASSDYVWRSRFPELNPDPGVSVKEWYRLFQNSESPSNAWIKHDTFTILWKTTAINCFRSGFEATYFTNQTKTDHTGNITSSYLDEKNGNTRLLTGSIDKTIKLWILNDHRSHYKLSESLEGHQGAITALKTKQNFIFSCSTDRMIHVWLLSELTGKHELFQRLQGHQGTVTCIETSQSPKIPTLFTGSTDKTIRVWCENKLQVLKGHKGNITCLRVSVDDNQLYSGAEDGTVRVWKQNSERDWRAVQVIQAHSSPITDLVYYQYRGIFCTTASNELKVHSRKGKDRQWTTEPETHQHTCKIKRIQQGYYNSEAKTLEFFLITDKSIDIVHLKNRRIVPTKMSYEIQ